MAGCAGTFLPLTGRRTANPALQAMQETTRAELIALVEVREAQARFQAALQAARGER